MNRPAVAFVILASKVAEGDIEAVRNFLLNKNFSANECDDNGQSLLMIAAQHGHMAVVNELLAQGADVNAEDSDNWSALTNAAKFGFKDVVVKLLDHGAEIEHRDMGQWTPLMWACYKGHFYIVKILLDHGAMVNVLDKNHCTPLIWASGRGYLEIVEALIERGAKAYSSDKYGTTPLVWACRKGFIDIVHVLLNSGANVDTAGMFSWTPLIVATRGNFASIVNMLLERKPNVNAIDMDGCTALSIACKEGFTEIAKSLMNAGAYINLPDRNGDTNLIHAAKAGHFSIVDTLIRKYADIDLAGADGKTALYWATEKGYADIVRLLLSANPNCEIATKDGDTPLLKATRNRNAEIVQLFVDKKCKVSAADKKGDTALHIAMRARSKAIVEVLLRNPKNSQLLYRPNRAGETPYNIDTNHQKSILAQIFGARRLNTNEDSENRLGYDLYSSALADILSEPSLSMPISVGLYAKWGSGKSFLLSKLENEMKSFAIQWLEPMFEFSRLAFLLVLLISCLSGLTVSLSTHIWAIGGYFSAGVFLFALLFLGAVIYCNKNYDLLWMSKTSIVLANQLNSLRTFLFVMFCSPPVNKRDTLSDPVRFLFTEQTKVTSSGGDNSIIQIVISLHLAIEKEFGFMTSRLYRVLKPKPVSSQRWQYRKICCIPNFLIVAVLFISLIGCIALLLMTDAVSPTAALTEHITVVRSILIAMACVIIFIVVSNLCMCVRIFAALFISHQRRIVSYVSHLSSSKAKNYVSSLKSEVDTIVQMVQCLDAFAGQQTRLVIIVDGLDSCEQEKVLHILDAMHLLFSDSNSPFVTVLAIDPHIVIKAIESNIHRVFEKSNISGYEYLRNVVHLPFYLQNSGLRRVKAAQQAALLLTKKASGYWNEDRECDRSVAPIASNRKASNSSMSIPDAFRKRSKGNQKLKASESLASSISNLHRVVTGAQDLTKVLLTDDYFSDVNPRSMRRLMNIVYITGRLLKAFNIDFNWYHLASWVNITEQWPYRTSWIIMYYEMHESEFDEMLPLKTVYERIKCFMPVSKDEEPTLDLDHDERKFEVFLSFHSSSLLINDLKVFLPFTINLDPYIRKVIQENHQEVSEFLKIDLKPSNSPPSKGDKRHSFRVHDKIHQHLLSPLHAQKVVRPVRQGKGDIYLQQMTPPYQNAPPPPPPPPWWSHQNDQIPVPTTMYPGVSPLVALPDFQDLSDLSVEGVSSLLRSQHKINKKNIENCVAAIEKHNINGQVLLTCDLKELKDTLNMSFGDWELFRVLILALREQEIRNLTLYSPFQKEKNCLLRVNSQKQHAFKQEATLKACTSYSPEPKAKESSSTVQRQGSENAESSLGISRRPSTVLEKQVTMEESMIVGALETLNEEAQEDAMEEQNLHSRKPSAAASNPLSPILSDTEELIAQDKLDVNPIPNVMTTPSEVDTLYLRSLQNSPMLRVSAISLSDSLTDIETSSIGRCPPSGFENNSPAHTRRSINDDYDAISISSTHSRKLESEHAKHVVQRPSSLVYDAVNYEVTTKNEPSKSKPNHSLDKLNKNYVEKPNVATHSTVRTKHSKKKSNSKSDSSDSSTETEERPRPVKVPAQKSLPTPVSDADGFYSDDEHTPLVSPFHTNRSHYNLQSSKSEKDCTPEKSIPKQSHSDVGPHRKIRNPLERQYSIDSNLCDHSRKPTTSTSMVEISSPMKSNQCSTNQTLVHGLPVYDQDVSDSSPEYMHNETIL